MRLGDNVPPEMLTEFRKDAVHAAYARLGEQERTRIDGLIWNAVQEMRSRRAFKNYVGFGEGAALELIGKVGLFLAEADPKRRLIVRL
jgi:hypothetical protein